MSGNKKLVLLRLEKEESRMNNDPIENAWVAREGLLNFHFCIHSLDGAYAGGYYHGVLQLSEDYPFAPPKLMFFTPSGRFEVAKPICTTFTNFHKQTWTSSWTVRTMITATISFMTTDGENGVGSISDSFSSRRNYAKLSFESNLKNPLFQQLFKRQIRDIQQNGFPSKILGTSKESQGSELDESKKAKSKNIKIQYFLYVLVIALIILWAQYKQ